MSDPSVSIVVLVMDIAVHVSILVGVSDLNVNHLVNFVWLVHVLTI